MRAAEFFGAATASVAEKRGDVKSVFVSKASFLSNI